MRVVITAIVLSLLAVVNAAEFNVTVGINNTLTYSPWSVAAREGDVITFHFVSKNHTVTQSTFADPCTPVAQGLDSGFRPANNSSHPTFNVTVTNSSSPVWFYCAQTGHCINGMVFAVDPTADKSFDAFQAKAKSLNPNGSNSSSSSSNARPTSTSTSVTPSSSQASGTMRVAETTLGIVTAAAVAFGLIL